VVKPEYLPDDLMAHFDEIKYITRHHLTTRIGIGTGNRVFCEGCGITFKKFGLLWVWAGPGWGGAWGDRYIFCPECHFVLRRNRTINSELVKKGEGKYMPGHGRNKS